MLIRDKLLENIEIALKVDLSKFESFTCILIKQGLGKSGHFIQDTYFQRFFEDEYKVFETNFIDLAYEHMLRELRTKALNDLKEAINDNDFLPKIINKEVE